MDESGNHIRQEQQGEFLRRLRRHEQAAFGELVGQFSQPLFRVAYSMVGNAADAEDVVQETFTAAFAGISKFRGESSLKTWLMQILVRQSARLQRSRGRRLTIGIEKADEPVHDPASATYALSEQKAAVLADPLAPTRLRPVVQKKSAYPHMNIKWRKW